MKRNILYISFCLLLSFTFSLVGFAQNKGSVLFKNATILTVTNGELTNTDLLIEKGVIKRIAPNINPPKGVEVVDATGKYIMPGIVDAHSHLNTLSTNEGTNPVTAEVTIEESINPNRVAIYRALAGGVSTIHLMHGSANVIGGQNETLKLKYGHGMDDMRFEEAPRTIKFALGENPTRVHGQNSGIFPRTRMGVEQVVRSHFEAARDYRMKRKAYLDAKKRYDRRRRGTPPIPIAKNVRLEVLADILDGKIWVHCHSYRADEIMMLMRVFKDYNVKNYTFQHVNEGYKIAPELRKHQAGASVFSDWWAYKFEVYYSTAYNATILNANGVLTSINSDSNELIRHLNHEAAKSMRYGQMSSEDALKLITINPAKQLGIDKYVGSLEVGKHGDISVWSKHPLSIYSICELTYIEGVKYFDREKDDDDMRIKIDPDISYKDTQYTYEEHESSHCIDDTFYLFSSDK